MRNKVSVLGIQTTLTKDIKYNLSNAIQIMESAFSLYKYIDMVILPEYFYSFPERHEADGIGPIPGEFLRTFSRCAKSNNTYIIAGTIINRRGDKLYNTSLLFDRKGEIVGSYDKVHLFDALNAKEEQKESNLISRGDKIFSFETDFGKIALMICYDIRFPEMARTMALQGVQFLFVPAAFYQPRFDHWQNLMQATALHNSMYVAGANLYSKMGRTSGFCGRSLIVDPWGIPLAMASDKPGFIQAYLDADYADKIGEAIGGLSNRVPSMYDVSQ